MQFKSFITLASLAALAVAAPNEIRDTPDADLTLTTHFTTETFTATRVLQSFIQKEPWVTTITTDTTWTVAHTVTRPVPTN
ncbi:hypothetical protein L226DRAFT_538951 [Lentinus tigrinus ALCF2SS1-7]|uniref:Uncharacterized protein n=1 Tax=Lentinus tigrinus ALCF2SS1-6 TaxID=1328759 RepID=A0A5C2RV98_9APHY|nr:hypothetical protein L227DRAFT_657154 [Lentinus tigrinus ALCF2SS1-6]RPD70306.1 hypothetical protein L226DRAFT_538951 [Lentinus tigrinus ALCF2SS1-7]